MVAICSLAGHLDLDCECVPVNQGIITDMLQVAPILIWRAWGIRDTMGWRTQTIGCCISKYASYVL